MAEINSRKAAPRLALVAALFLGPIFVALLSWHASISALSVLVLGAISIPVAHVLDLKRRTTSLHYDLDPGAKDDFLRRQRLSQILSAVAAVWRLRSQQGTSDWKRNAGANSLVKRTDVFVGRCSPPCIETNVEIWGVDSGDCKLFFFPDRLFVLQHGKYGAVAYDTLAVDAACTQFIEDGNVPKDAQIVGHTWQYVRKDGGPDRRFGNNRQLPVVLYGLVTVTSSSGLNIHLHVSNPEVVKQLSRRPDPQPRSSEPRSQRRRKRPARETETPPLTSSGTDNTGPYEILGVSPDASIEAITAAYKKMAQMYHPDKVAGLGPELREVAERKMKEINGAFDTLRRIHG